MSKIIGAALLFLATAGVASAFQPIAAPEIDPASAVSGLTLLLGGLAVYRGRRAQKK